MHAEGAGSQALTLQSCTPPEAFTGGSFQVSLGALDGRKLPFSVDVSLDSGTGDSLGHLPQHYEVALESGLIQSDKDFASRDEYCNYLNHLTGADIDSALPSISLSCTLAGTYLDLPISTTGPLTVAGGLEKSAPTSGGRTKTAIWSSRSLWTGISTPARTWHLTRDLSSS